jgi:DNA-binding NarL/FixJ family response regulator
MEAPLFNKAFRILIADTQHFHRMRIERLFNQLGYFAVAPAQNLEELLRLTEYGTQPFDLVVINGAMANGSLNLLDYFVDNQQVRHAFIFDGRQAHRARGLGCVREKVWISPAELPDLASIERLMAAVDVRLPLVGTVISVR